MNLSNKMDMLMNLIRENNDGVFDAMIYTKGETKYESFCDFVGSMNCYSVSKNYTATAIGLLYDEGRLALDTPITDIFPEYFTDDALKQSYSQVTIHHLLNQTIGLQEGFLFEGDRYKYEEKNWLKLSLSAPLVHEIGEKFIYSNSNYYVLSCVVSKLTGLNMEDYLRQKLFNPLGLESYAWERCPRGEAMGATGLYMTTPDMLKFGLMYFRNGDGYLSEDWIKKACTNQVNKPGQSAYGYSFWINGDRISCSGAFGQVILLYPQHDTVFAAHAVKSFNYGKYLNEYFASL